VQDLALTVSQRVAVPPLRRGTGVRDTSTRGRTAAAQPTAQGHTAAQGHEAPQVAAETPRATTERAPTETRVETPVATVTTREREPATTAEAPAAEAAAGEGAATKTRLLDPFGRRRTP